MKTIECQGCHRNMFSIPDEEYKGDSTFKWECPMCGTKGSTKADTELVFYDKFLTDPKLKGKVEVPAQPTLPPPPPGLGEETPGKDGPTISLQLSVNPPGSLSKNEEYVLQELLNAAMGQFQMIVQSGQVQNVAAKMKAMKKQMESGIVTPEMGGFPKNL